MSLGKKLFRYHFELAALLLLVPLTSAQSQSNKLEPPVVSGPKLETKAETPRTGNDDEMEQLKSQVRQLQSLLEQQQRALAEIQKRLDEKDGQPRPAAQVVSTGSDGAVNKSSELRSSTLELSESPRTSSAANQPSSQNKPVGVAGWDRDHAFIRSADGNFETYIGGYAQLDFRGYQSGIHPPNTFLIRRARLSAEGKVARYFDYRLEGDFADTTSTLLRDFYVNIHRTDKFQLRFGQFRVPISQEEIRSDNYQDFVERSMVNNLVPSRSPGLGATGVLGKGVFEYQIGAFNGKGLLANNNNGTPETAIRLRFAPWKNGSEFISKGFSFGGAFTYGRSLGGLSVRGLTESRSFIFFVPDIINGKYLRANGEFTWMLGPAAIRVEYDQTNQRRDNLGPDGGNLPGVVAKGYTGQFTYLLTGEEKPEAGLLSPRHNLFGDGNGNQGFGAWELKFRYANLQIADATAQSNRADSFYFGPNWYLNRYVRYMLDLGFERFKDPARSPRPGDRNFFVILSRVQVAF